MLGRLLSEYWRKETEKSKVFCRARRSSPVVRAICQRSIGVVDRLDVERSILRSALGQSMLERLLSEYPWRKETEKSKVFCVLTCRQKQTCGVVGLDGRCSAQAEQRKKPVAVVHLPGAYLSTETNLVPIRGVMKKEFDTGHTQTRRHTHGMKIAPLGLAGGRSYDRTNSLRTPTMQESQLLREKTTSSVFLSTCSNAVHAQFH